MEILLRVGNTEESFKMADDFDGRWSCVAKGVKFLLTRAKSSIRNHSLWELVAEAENGCELFSVAPDWIGVEGFALPNSTSQALANGYQCWTDSPLLSGKDWLSEENNPDQVFYGDDALWEYAKEPGHFHSWSFSYLVGEQYAGQPLMASACEDDFLSLFELDLNNGSYRTWLDVEGYKWLAGSSKLHAWVLPDSNESDFPDIGDSVAKWSELVAQHRRIGSLSDPELRQVRGYCSWYRHYTDVTEQKLLDDCRDWGGSNSVKIFQIDDGYQRVPGDWNECHDGFDSGSLARVVASAQAKGFIPGIWMAPFIVHSRAKLFQDHQDWLLRNMDGSPVQCGNHGLWGGPFYALDSELAEVRSFVASQLRYWKDMGFGFVKLDFLYASSMIPSSGKTRAMRGALAHQWLAETCSDLGLQFLSCGAVLSAAYGRSDFCRIGPDVAPQWEWEEQRHYSSREKISTRASIVNAITRKPLDGSLLCNDCDVSILRSSQHGLTLEEQRVLLEVNATCSSLLFTSDSPSLCLDQRESLLRDWLALSTWMPGSKIAQVVRTQQGYLLYSGKGERAATLSVDLVEGCPRVCLESPSNLRVASVFGQ